mmetsp:Transcript_1047/g.3735  ORF Transcript_1047/g.3735 Transcript_1047/m.3735 type:complete len:768 (-) Transcript_1047:41-2344(-)
MPEGAEDSPTTRRAKQTEKKLRDNAAMEEIWKKIPKEIIRPTVNRSTGKTEKVHFVRGAFLGKGGFARVYEMKDMKTGVVYAGKIIAKKALSKPRSKQKLVQEIKIHKALDHENIVKFVSFVEDRDFVFIILEMCSNRSLLRMIRARKHVCEAELRYYLRQMVSGISYLKQQLVIHRDLKLGNLFLDHNMTIKMGDFGLAAKLEHANERKKTICGTPNYIAPEVLRGNSTGHSFEVDVWSLGVIMYTLLVGRPPFETKDLKSTYKKIAAVSYAFPAEREDISANARDLVKIMLNPEPSLRPPIEEIMNHPFLSDKLVPAYLPKTSMQLQPEPRSHGDFSPKSPTHYWMASPAPSQKLLIKRKPIKRPSPAQQKTDTVAKAGAVSASKANPSSALSPRKLLLSPNSQMTSVLVAPEAHIVSRVTQLTSPRGAENAANAKTAPAPVAAKKPLQSDGKERPVDKVLYRVGKMIGSAVKQVNEAHKYSSDDAIANANARVRHLIEATANRIIDPSTYTVSDPRNEALHGNVMVARWVDYTFKYGLVYQLSNLSLGISFIDNSKVIIDPATNTVDYYVAEENGASERHFRFHFSEAPPSMEKKMNLLVYFSCIYAKKEMSMEEMAKSMRARVPGKAPPSRHVYIQRWTRKKNAVIFRLNDGNIQVNFLDHNKLLIWAGGAKLLWVTASLKKVCYDMRNIMCAPTVAKREAQTAPVTTRQDLQLRLRQVQPLMLRLADGSLRSGTSSVAASKAAAAATKGHRPRTHRVLIPTQ